MQLPDLNDATLPAFVGAAEQPVVLVFHARWSKPARTMLPVVADLAENYDRLLSFALVDADASPQALYRYGVLSLPSYLLLSRGRVVGRYIGLQTKERLAELLEAGIQRV